MALPCTLICEGSMGGVLRALSVAPVFISEVISTITRNTSNASLLATQEVQRLTGERNGELAALMKKRSMIVSTVELVDAIHAGLQEFIFRTGMEPNVILLTPAELQAIRKNANHLVLHLPTCYKVMGYPVILVLDSAEQKVALILET